MISVKNGNLVISKIIDNENGSIKGNIKLVPEIVNHLEKNKPCEIQEGKIKIGNRNIEFSKENNENVKSIEEVGKKILTLTQEEYSFLTSGLYAISKDKHCNDRIKGVLFTSNSNKNIEVVCSDGYRLTKRTINKEFEEKIVLDDDTIKVLNKIKFKTLEFYYGNSNNEIIIKTDNDYVLSSLLYNVDYFDYNRVINYEEKNKIEVSPEKILNIISSYKGKEKNTLIALILKDNTLTIEYRTALFTIDDKIEIDYQGEQKEIYINSNYLKEALKDYSNLNYVSIYINNSNSPIYIIDNENKMDLICLLRKPKKN